MSLRLSLQRSREFYPDYRAQLHILGRALMIHLFLSRIQGGKAPPARPRNIVRKDAVLVSFDHLGRKVDIRDRVGIITIVIFHFHHGTGHRLSVQQYAPLEEITAVIGKGASQRNNLRLQPQGDVPALLLAEGSYYGLGIVQAQNRGRVPWRIGTRQGA